jgi:hypothetical protein
MGTSVTNAPSFPMILVHMDSFALATEGTARTVGMNPFKQGFEAGFFVAKIDFGEFHCPLQPVGPARNVLYLSNRNSRSIWDKNPEEL